MEMVGWYYPEGEPDRTTNLGMRSVRAIVGPPGSRVRELESEYSVRVATPEFVRSISLQDPYTFIPSMIVLGSLTDAEIEKALTVLVKDIVRYGVRVGYAPGEPRVEIRLPRSSTDGCST